MSMGFGFRAKLEESDGKVAAYSYRTYDLSCEEGRQGFGAAELDGVLWVAPEQSCLNMSRAAVVVWGSSKRPLVSTLRVVAPDIIPADVKATSRAPFARP